MANELRNPFHREPVPNILRHVRDQKRSARTVVDIIWRDRRIFHAKLDYVGSNSRCLIHPSHHPKGPNRRPETSPTITLGIPGNVGVACLQKVHFRWLDGHLTSPAHLHTWPLAF